MSQHVSVLLLGSNLGNKTNNIEEALKCLENEGCEIFQKTEIAISLPVEFVSSNNFCNIATSIRMHYSPVQLLNIIKKIERNMGRMYDSKAIGGYEDRIIDIDIISFDGINFSSRKLEIPHLKNTLEREFSKVLLIELENLNKKHNI
ncbi:2-amino-4-hydroxy-6-hydroxymethyldihydropteridine diphosphokinase [Frigoriflavimonas asaccharolytica]|uniref:2-amino-4-hydroxy-6-hydroxymethyldihydropteridine pyrophosphokinase n=1 Tax=Frigoriflavimonas asaccharolytica TaxID=2735899 RepID=A0A8J8K525_9FLAO|nr:2-amino-4-hydroxy-6-hydroxymethyldihydropteridine diphosphokinase [Frigoriflavimonas asaccharolytica]NRS92370.1 2-amino-4-hydroxy-6-hydroxymethyldihydropteridine diphosphokinase [Frigoriflavimonas asaccharolytica]